MGKLAPELIWALRQQALWGSEQEADKTTPGQKENTSWPLLLGVMVLLMIVMMMMRRRRRDLGAAADDFDEEEYHD